MPSAPRVAIIGAGAAGLCAARAYLSAGLPVRIYEASGDIGGTWAYSPKPSATSSLYASLRCNLPKQIMPFPDLPFPPQARSFASHTEVLSYLREYATLHDLRRHVAFHTPVTSVAKEGASWRVVSTEGVGLYQFVVVANGHYSVPNSWRPVGTDDFVKEGRTVSHSHLYKEPSAYKGRSVVVVGAGPSGIDISLEISHVAKSVVLSHSNYSDSLFAGRVPQADRVVSLSSDGNVSFANGKVLRGVDDVLCCTGYEYSLPFLQPGSAGVSVSANARAVDGLVAHLFAREDPTIAFMGLVWKVLPFPLFHVQAEFLVHMHLGRIPSSKIDDLYQWEMDERGENKPDERYAHMLADAQWEYRRRLASLSGSVMPTPAEIEIARDASVARRRNPGVYREREYHMLGPAPGQWRVTLKGVDVTGRDDPASPKVATFVSAPEQ